MSIEVSTAHLFEQIGKLWVEVKSRTENEAVLGAENTNLREQLAATLEANGKQATQIEELLAEKPKPRKRSGK